MNQRGSKMRSLVRRGWLSNEHGAWVMTVLPIIVGICTVHPQPIQFLLLAAWTAAYCAFHALSLYWAASPKRRRTYLPAFLTWASIAVVCGVPVIVMHPHAIVRIIIPITLFCAVATYEAFRKRRRSIVSHVSSVLASSCTLPLSIWITSESYSQFKLWCAAVAVAAYMLGSIVYVRSLIRGAHKKSVYIVSVAWHLALVVACLIGVLAHGLPGGVLLAFVVIALRAILIPALHKIRHLKIPPLVIGLGEYVSCACLFSAVLAIVR